MVISHGDGLYTFYAHLSSISTDLGSVEQGETIGISGNSGYTLGENEYHLHFSILQIPDHISIAPSGDNVFVFNPEFSEFTDLSQEEMVIKAAELGLEAPGTEADYAIGVQYNSTVSGTTLDTIGLRAVAPTFVDTMPGDSSTTVHIVDDGSTDNWEFLGAIEYGRAFSGSETETETDWVKFSAVEGETYSIRVSGKVSDGLIALEDTLFTIRDPSNPELRVGGTATFEHDDVIGKDSAIIWAPESSGDYFIAVGSGGTDFLHGGYRLSIVRGNILLTGDGPLHSNSGALTDSSGSSAGVVSLEAPTFMADGDAEYTVSLGNVAQGVQYNIAYIIDLSTSMRGQKLMDAKNAYIELTNQLIDLGIADSARFGVVPFSSSADLVPDLTAQEAIDYISSLNVISGTNFGPALSAAETFFASTNAGQTNIAYFLSDGQGSGASDALTNLANVQAFGIGTGPRLETLNLIDSGDAVVLGSSDQLVEVITDSGVDATAIDRIEISVNGQLFETITPDQLVDGPLGLQYTGTLSGLNVGEDRHNPVKTEVYLTDGSVSGLAELSIASAHNGTSIVSDGAVDKVKFGAATTSFNADAYGFPALDLLANNLNNTVSAVNAGGTFKLFGGDDVQESNHLVDSTIDGGDGYDIVKYVVDYVDGFVQKLGNIFKVGWNSDTLTNVEEIRFNNAVVYTDNFTVVYNTPPLAQDDIFAVDEDATLSGNVLDDNGGGADSDPDGNALTARLISGPAEGVLVFAADGSFTYEADAELFDLATPGDVIDQSFTYEIDDGRGAVDQATATISVTILDDGIKVVGRKHDAHASDNAHGFGHHALVGSDGGEDLILGTRYRDEMYGLDGADIIKGGRGNDMIRGGESADTLSGGKGWDSLYGEEGSDALFGGRGHDHLFGGAGEDFLTGGRCYDALDGGTGNDLLRGGGGRDVFIFSEGFGEDIVLDFNVRRGEVLDFTDVATSQDDFTIGLAEDGIGTRVMLNETGEYVDLLGVAQDGFDLWAHVRLGIETAPDSILV